MKADHVVIQWGSLDSANLGVQALTEGTLHVLDEAAEALRRQVRVTVIGPRGGGGGVDRAIERNREIFSRLQLQVVATKYGFPPPITYWKALRSAGVVIDLSQGDSFATIYGLRRMVSQSVTKAAVILVGRDLILAPQTYGPFESRFARAVARALVGRSCAAFSRDSQIPSPVASLPNPVAQSSDIAYVVAPAEATTASLDNDRQTAALNVSGLLWRKGINHGIPQYQTIVQEVVEELRAASYRVILVPHVIGATSTSDEEVLEEVQELVKADGTFVPRSFGEVVGCFAEVDLVVASRMHASIAGVSAGTATVALSYSPKFSGQFGLVEYPGVVELQRRAVSDVIDDFRPLLEGVNELSSLARRSGDLGRSLSSDYRQLLTDRLVRTER